MNKNRTTAIIVGILILVAYLMLLTHSVDPFLGMFLEIISGLAVIGISILMFPLFKKHITLTKGYLIGKFVEGGLMFAAGFMVLIGNLIAYNKLYAVHAYFFIISAFIFYVLLYKLNLIPKWISVWGMIASVLLLIVNLLVLGGFSLNMVLTIIGYAPIILNEVFLAVWLIVKGFKVQ